MAHAYEEKKSIEKEEPTFYASPIDEN